MNWTAVGAIGQCFAAIGTIAAVGYVLFQDRWKRPKLRLSFDNDRDVKSQTNTVGRDPSEHQRWLRVRVVNANRRRVAKRCRAFLIGIERVGPEGEVTDEFPNDVRPMLWTHDPSESTLGRDLLPGVVHWVDVVGAVEGQMRLDVQVRPKWALGDPGIRIFTIQVAAENADPAVIKVEVKWEGGWTSLSGREV